MRRRLLLAPLLLLPLVVPAVHDRASADVPAATDGQSTYVPVAPQRVLDTRNGTGHSGAVGQGASIDLALGLPSDATAAVLNVTATRASTSTVVRVYPTSGGAVPTVSNLNVPKGGTVADLVVTKLGTGGSVRFFNDSGTTDLVADLAGYYVSGGAQAGFHGTAPLRLVDTRTAQVPLQAGAPRTVDPHTAADGSATGVPATATAVAVTLTAVQPSTDTVLRAYPTGSTVPTVSNLNPKRGTIVANLADVQLSSAGTFDLLNGAGSSNVVVDLVGWYTPGDGDVFHPLDPFRALDTRTAAQPVAAGSPRSLTLAGAGSVPWSATSVAVTLTAVQPKASTYLTLYPAAHGSTTAPVASTLNAPAGSTVPAAAVVAAGDEGVARIKNYTSTTDVVLDVAGWFGPAGEGYDISWPQCNSDGTSDHPATAANAVIGLTDGKPYTLNPCLQDEFTWASTQRGGGAGYIILNAPGPSDANWSAHSTPKTCDGTDSAGCAYDYGWWASDYALQQLPVTSTGGRPQVWLDVEGPYANGPTWDSSTGINAAVISGALARLRGAGIRTGVYSRQKTYSSSGARTDDWYKLTGGLTVPGLQQWVFTAKDEPTAAANCDPLKAFTSGSVVLSQYQTQVDSTTYDTDHTC